MTERLHFCFSLSCIGEGNGNPLQCSCLENPRDGGAWWAAVYGVAQSQTRLKWLSSSSSSIQQKINISNFICLTCPKWFKWLNFHQLRYFLISVSTLNFTPVYMGFLFIKMSFIYMSLSLISLDAHISVLNPDTITGSRLHERTEMIVKMSEDEY